MKQVNLYLTSVEAMQALTQSLMHSMENVSADRDFNLIVSGGNTGVSLFDFWVEHYRTTIKWQQIVLFWADERCVKATQPESNYGNAWTHLLSRVPIRPAAINRISGVMNPEEEAERYAALIESRHLHYAILGLGQDGHSASLFPHQFPLWRPDVQPRLAFAVQREKESFMRVTLGVQALNRCDQISYLVLGADKKTVVSQLVASSGNSSAFAAQYIRPLNRRSVFYVSYADDKADLGLMDDADDVAGLVR